MPSVILPVKVLRAAIRRDGDMGHVVKSAVWDE